MFSGKFFGTMKSNDRKDPEIMKDEKDKNRMARKQTTEMEKELSKSMELGTFLNEHKETFISYEVADVLNEVLQKKKVTKAEAARRAQMSDIYLFQIVGGRRRPSRDRMICICVGLGCSLEETRDVLRKCRFADLYARDRRDAVIMFALEHGWGLEKLNDALYEADEETLV